MGEGESSAGSRVETSAGLDDQSYETIARSSMRTALRKSATYSGSSAPSGISTVTAIAAAIGPERL
jgi:hypothetical protein